MRRTHSLPRACLGTRDMKYRHGIATPSPRATCTCSVQMSIMSGRASTRSGAVLEIDARLRKLAVVVQAILEGSHLQPSDFTQYGLGRCGVSLTGSSLLQDRGSPKQACKPKKTRQRTEGQIPQPNKTLHCRLVAITRLIATVKILLLMMALIACCF